MEKNDIVKSNKLIADFMGLKISFSNQIVNPIRPYHSVFGLWFHTSWDWLMPVVEKIESTGAIFDIHREASKVRVYITDVKEWGATHCDEEIKINHVYKSVIEYIKWYNQQNTNPLT